MSSIDVGKLLVRKCGPLDIEHLVQVSPVNAVGPEQPVGRRLDTFPVGKEFGRIVRGDALSGIFVRRLKAYVQDDRTFLACSYVTECGIDVAAHCTFIIIDTAHKRIDSGPAFHRFYLYDTGGTFCRSFQDSIKILGCIHFLCLETGRTVIKGAFEKRVFQRPGIRSEGSGDIHLPVRRLGAGKRHGIVLLLHSGKKDAEHAFAVPVIECTRIALLLDHYALGRERDDTVLQCTVLRRRLVHGEVLRYIGCDIYLPVSAQQGKPGGLVRYVHTVRVARINHCPHIT